MNVNKSWGHCAATLCLFLGLSYTWAETDSLYCRADNRTLAAPADTAGTLKYPRSREIEILHLALDITPDFREQSIQGKAMLRFTPIAKPFEELRLDAVDLAVHSVTSTEKILGWQATTKEVIVTFDKPIPAAKETTVTITYQAHPKQGLYFRTPEMGYKPGDTHLWTQGESEFARHWFPSFDSPNEKFTSEVTCRVPEGMVVLSNGRKVSEERDTGSGLMAVRWLQDKPHVNYLIFLAAGYFKKIEDRYRDIPLAFYTPASQIDLAKNSFAGTKDMMAFFEEEIGVPYPWNKYDQVCVNDFTAGGMENTSITALNDSTLHPPEFENLRESQGLVAHELSHQWFGDLVTCKDWANLWINEGFATYYEHLYDGHKHGRDTLLMRMHQGARHLVSMAGAQTNSIVRRDYHSPDDMFDSLAYGKGAWVLHMLRSQLGADLYRQCIKAFLEKYKFKNAGTEDLKAVIEEISGRSFEQFFDQWVYHAGQPELSVNYSWDERTKLAKVSVQQVQRLSSEVLLFNVPLPLRFQFKNAAPVERTITVKEKSEDFYLPLPEAPELVRIDPDLTVLAKINFTPPSSMLYAQLADKKDGFGRMLAVEQLSGKKEALAKLKDALNQDSFYAVRVAASKSLRAIATDEAMDALLTSTKQSDARVRRQVLSDVLSTYGEKSCQAALQFAKQEKNPDIQAAAILALGAYDKPEIREQLLTALKAESFRNVLPDAAIRAMRAQDDANYLQPIRETMKTVESNFTSHGFGQGLEALGWLGRKEEKKESTRDFITNYVNSKKKRVQLSAISALGILGDTKTIALLETFTTAPTKTPERDAAERALASVRDNRKPSVELGTLRSELLTLQKENRDLRKDFDDLKKKFEAISNKETKPKPAPVPRPVKSFQRD